MIKPTIRYGNLKGLHFTQWRIDDILIPLAQKLRNKIPEIESFEIFYDPADDYHHLTFTYDSRCVDITFYKVLTYRIENLIGWQGCPSTWQIEFVNSIHQALFGKEDRPLS